MPDCCRNGNGQGANQHAAAAVRGTHAACSPGVNATPTLRSPFGPSAHPAWTLEGGRVSLVRPVLRPRPVQIDAQPQGITIDLVRPVVSAAGLDGLAGLPPLRRIRSPRQETLR